VPDQWAVSGGVIWGRAAGGIFLIIALPNGRQAIDFLPKGYTLKYILTFLLFVLKTIKIMEGKNGQYRDRGNHVAGSGDESV